MLEERWVNRVTAQLPAQRLQAGVWLSGSMYDAMGLVPSTGVCV